MIQPTNTTHANNINMALQSWHFEGCTQATFNEIIRSFIAKQAYYLIPRAKTGGNIFDARCFQIPEIREEIPEKLHQFILVRLDFLHRFTIRVQLKIYKPSIPNNRPMAILMTFSQIKARPDTANSGSVP